MNQLFENKKVLIVGGTGSLGNHLTRYILSEIYGTPKELHIMSRDELKQFRMRSKFKENNIKFHIGDVRDVDSVKRIIRGKEIILNLSALKHVPPYEFNPIEAIKTNTLGVQNLTNAIIENKGVEKFIQVSTDKACKPVNVYGMTKALAERITLAANLHETNTDFISVRYGNVLSSRGSFLPILREKLMKNEEISITNKSMTRFFMTMEDSCDLIMRAIDNSLRGTILIPKIPCVRIIDVVEYMKNHFGSNSKIKEVGIRPGEKIHEILISEEEIPKTKIYKQDYVVIAEYLEDPMTLPSFSKFNILKNKNLKNSNLVKEYSSKHNIIEKPQNIGKLLERTTLLDS